MSDASKPDPAGASGQNRSHMTGEQAVSVPGVKNEPPRAFAQFIQHLEDGQLHQDLSDSLKDMAAELSNHVLAFGGKPSGTITLKLNFKLDQGVFDIRADFTTKLPKAPRDRTIMWTTDGHNFVRDNPRQMKMPFGVRQIDGDSPPPIQI